MRKWLIAVAVVTAAAGGAAVYAIAGHGPGDSVTGCVTPGGQLTRVAVGEMPASACRPNETQVHLAEGDVTGVIAGAGLQGGGTDGEVALSVDTSAVQGRIDGSCEAGSSIRAVAADGSVTCEEGGAPDLDALDGAPCARADLDGEALVVSTAQNGAVSLVCTNVSSDPYNCGAIGNDVGDAFPHASGACVSGASALGPCDAGWYDGDGDSGNGCELQGDGFADERFLATTLVNRTASIAPEGDEDWFSIRVSLIVGDIFMPDKIDVAGAVMDVYLGSSTTPAAAAVTTFDFTASGTWFVRVYRTSGMSAYTIQHHLH